jgi:hypothetical protein
VLVDKSHEGTYADCCETTAKEAAHDQGRFYHLTILPN